MISIIIATHNAGATLGRCLQSLACQQDAAFETLISDGASSDDTLAVARQYADVVSELRSGPDGGVYDAWNRMIPKARGEWLMFLGADDALASDITLADAAAALAAVPPPTRECSFAFGATELHDGHSVIEILGKAPLEDNRLDVAADIPFAHTGLFHHRSLFDAFGLFDADFRSAGDYEFMLRAARDPRTQFHHLPMTVAQMAAGGMSNSVAGRAHHYREMKLAREKLGMDMPGWLRNASYRAQVMGWLGRVLAEKQMTYLANIYRGARGKPRRQRI